jgi:hypothetical protein
MAPVMPRRNPSTNNLSARRASRSAQPTCPTASTSAKVCRHELCPETWSTDIPKVQEIKRSLIEKAKLKKEYAKIRARELDGRRKTVYTDPTPAAHDSQASSVSDSASEGENDGNDHTDSDSDAASGNEDTKPDDKDDAKAKPSHTSTDSTGIHPSRSHLVGPRQRRQKHDPFAQEASRAAAQKARREEAERQRAQKQRDRERMRGLVRKSRQTDDKGRRKLGREAPVLLEKVKRLVGDK